MSSFKTIAELGLPNAINDIIDSASHGLILVNGGSGEGKTTTITSMVDRVNNTSQKVIVMLEDPIEFKHEDNLSRIYQKETDGNNVKQEINDLLRMRPDILVLGELRSAEAVESAIWAAMTGHLVIATMHTSNTVLTIERIVDIFPADRQNRIRTDLAANIHSIISQRLILVDDGTKRAPVVEIFRQTGLTKELLKDPAKMSLIPIIIQNSQYLGMQTMEDDLNRLVSEKRISPEAREQFLNGAK